MRPADSTHNMQPIDPEGDPALMCTKCLACLCCEPESAAESCTGTILEH